MSKKNIIVVSILFLIVVGFQVFTYLSKEENAYIDMPVLYNEFAMTKEMDSQYQSIIKNRNQILDSLKEELEQVFNDKMTKEEEAYFLKKREKYIEKLEKFESENKQMNEEFTSKIWDRLDKYIKKYGKDKSFAFIYGANGQGNVLYADDKKDITKDVIEYANKLFLGEK